MRILDLRLRSAGLAKQAEEFEAGKPLLCVAAQAGGPRWPVRRRRAGCRASPRRPAEGRRPCGGTGPRVPGPPARHRHLRCRPQAAADSTEELVSPTSVQDQWAQTRRSASASRPVALRSHASQRPSSRGRGRRPRPGSRLLVGNQYPDDIGWARVPPVHGQTSGSNSCGLPPSRPMRSVSRAEAPGGRDPGSPRRRSSAPGGRPAGPHHRGWA